MRVQKTITVEDTDGKPGIILTMEDDDTVKVQYGGIRFSPPVVPIKDLDLAVMALRGETNGAEH